MANVPVRGVGSLVGKEAVSCEDTGYKRRKLMPFLYVLNCCTSRRSGSAQPLITKEQNMGDGFFQPPKDFNAWEFAKGMDQFNQTQEQAKSRKLLEEQVRLQREALELEKKKLAQEQEKINLERERLRQSSSSQSTPSYSSQPPPPSYEQTYEEAEAEIEQARRAKQLPRNQTADLDAIAMATSREGKLIALRVYEHYWGPLDYRDKRNVGVPGF